MEGTDGKPENRYVFLFDERVTHESSGGRRTG